VLLSCLIYSSTATITPSSAGFRDAMSDINARARIRNLELGITGFLMYFEGRFVQVLEGNFESVSNLFSTIRRDRRHRDVHIVSFLEVEERRFLDWSMEFSMNLLATAPNRFSAKASFINRHLGELAPRPIMRDILLSVSNEVRNDHLLEAERQRL
jgi:hypothetical protein